MEIPSELSKLTTLYHESRLTHACLIETNNQDQCIRDLKEIIKNINCPSEYKEGCSNCNLCNLLENNYLPSFIIIEKETNTIKKEQILELKTRFSTMPIYTKENIYIIKEAEKLNAESANTMLKFLEEPEDHIIGFFITNNINNVINTIKSRCETLKIKYKTEESEDLFENSYFAIAKQYLSKLCSNNEFTIMINREDILEEYNTRNDIVEIFNTMLQILRVLKKEKRNEEESEQLKELAELKEEQILQKERIIVKYIEELQFNVNIELFLDRFVIEMSD